MERKITRRAITALQPEPGKQSWIYDTELRGFMVLCQASGRKSYVVRYKSPAGSWRKHTIAPCTELHPDEARERARDILATARSGKDPVAESERARLAPTVADLAERHLREQVSKLKPKTAQQYEWLWRSHILPELGTARVMDLRRADIQRLHSKLADNPHTANRALAVIRKALNLAEVWGWRDEGTNPTRHVKAFQEHHRQRTLTNPELTRLWGILDGEEKLQLVPAAQLIKLLLLTGCRVSEWTHARWDWIDWDRQLLRLPESKTGARDVFLPDDAIKILDGLPRRSVFILPGKTGGHIQGLQKIWRRIRAQAGLDDVRLHDLRHTVGSLGHRAGLTQRQIADLLGHRQMATTARYINSADEHKRETVNAWGAEVTRLVVGK